MENRVPGPGWRTSLLGRRDECVMLDALVEGVRGGECRSLVLRGEAGIGKTALVDYAVECSAGLSDRARGVRRV